MIKQMKKLGKAVIIFEGTQGKISMYAMFNNTIVKFKDIGMADNDFSSSMSGENFKNILNLSMEEPSFIFENNKLKVNSYTVENCLKADESNDYFFNPFMKAPENEFEVPTDKIIKASAYADKKGKGRPLYQHICIGESYIAATTGYFMYRYSEEFNIEHPFFVHCEAVPFLDAKEKCYMSELIFKNSSNMKQSYHAIRQGNIIIYTKSSGDTWLDVNKVIPVDKNEVFENVNLKQFSGLFKTEIAKEKLRGSKEPEIDFVNICEATESNPRMKIENLQVIAKTFPAGCDIIVNNHLRPVIFKDGRELAVVCQMRREEKEAKVS